MKRRIYVPQIDQVFQTIAEASAALNVNAANISKVLSGKRKMAGGYNFISAVTSGGKKRSMASLRKEGRALLPDPLAEEREELRKAIRAVNQQARALSKSGFGSFSTAMQDLLALGDVFGRTKAGYLKSSEGLLRSLTQAEINKYMEAIEERKKRKSYSIGGAMSEAEHLAGTFWTTSSRIAELSASLPFLFAMLHNELQERGGSDVIRRVASEIFNNPGATDEDMIGALSELTDYFDTSEALEELLQNDYFMLDKFAPIRGGLEQLLQASKSEEYAGSEELISTIDDVSKMIFENWQREDVSDLLDIIEDDIRTTMFNLGIYGDDYDEED